MNADSSREVVIFTEVLEVPPDERHVYLDQACSGDEKLRSKVHALLQAHDRVGKFLEEPPTGMPVESIQETHHIEKAGDRIGRYKLLEQIGEGGCGVVFLAEQEEPVRRRVALKVIKPGMDSKSVIARFEAERQALALMDHPNIARLFDAGATEHGRPYFVMELISGIKITDYCDQKELSIEKRLGLFVQICQGVQHAHQKGVIHRDIKPSNILVATSSEGAPLPVVIDFGIAKATTHGQLTDKTFFTVFDFLVGTPAYMSPEQAALTGGDVDSRTDIYSLGVLLYELLAGTTPYDTRQLQKVGLEEILRVIREEEPARPSAKLRKTPAIGLKPIARCRQSEPAKLIRSVHGDLDWITMKALEKDRVRRYATANGLASDIQRYVAGEAIYARPPSTVYKLQKTVARNKPLFAGIGVVIMLLAFFLTREFQAHRRAATEAAKSQQVTRFLEKMLQGVGPSVAVGRDTTMLREILDSTSKEIDSGMAHQPAVEAEVCGLMGSLYRQIGKLDQAEKMDRTTLTLCRELKGRDSAEAATALDELGLTLTSEGKLTEAESIQRESLDVRRRLFGNENASVATSLNDLAHVYVESGNWPQAEALTRESLADRRRLFGDGSVEVSDSLRNLGIILGDEGHWVEAEDAEREVLAIRQNKFGSNDLSVASSLTDVAWAAGGRGKLDEAAALEQQALTIRQQMLPEDNPDIAVSLYLVGDRERQRGNLDQAYLLLTTALSMQHKILGDENPSSLDTLRSLALTLAHQGKFTEAEKAQREALASFNKMGQSESPRALVQLGDLARTLMGQNKMAEAVHLLDDALGPAAVKLSTSAELLFIRGSLRAREGRWQEAASDALTAFELEPTQMEHYAEVASLLVKAGDLAHYEQFCKRLLFASAGTANPYLADAVAKSCLFYPLPGLELEKISRLADVAVTRGADDSGALPFFQVCKALAEYRLGHFAEAADWAEKAINAPGSYAPQHAYAIMALADWQLGKRSEARTFFAKGNELAPTEMPAEIAQKLGNEWLGWLHARIQLDEAAALIQPDPVGK